MPSLTASGADTSVVEGDGDGCHAGDACCLDRPNDGQNVRCEAQCFLSLHRSA
jgi:hypothetical protein